MKPSDVPQHTMRQMCLALAVSAGAALLAGSLLKDKLLMANSSQEQVDTSQAASAEESLLAAQTLAWEASVLVQNPPHPVETWQEAKVKWRQAVRLLETVPQASALFEQTKKRLNTYRANYQAISKRLAAEQAAVANLEAAQTSAWQAAMTVQAPPHPLRVWQRAGRKWEEAIALLEPIAPTTSVAAESRKKLMAYRDSYNTIHQRIATETKALSTLRQFSQNASRLSTLATKALAGLTVEQTGTSYQDYAAKIQTLDDALVEFAEQPGAKNHPVYPELEQAIADYKLALKLWKVYLDLRQNNTQWLYDDFFNQLIPVSEEERLMLVRKYGIRTYSSGAKISLKFTVWEIWNRAKERIDTAQQKILSLG